MVDRISVGISEMMAAKAPCIIETQALGSCVSVVLYDAERKVGGLTHSMLPDEDSARKSLEPNPAKFVDSAVELLLKKVLKEGGKRDNLVARIVGGANMFPGIISSNASIGDRNIEVARRVLKKLKIKVVAEEVGGSSGRTVSLDVEKGRVIVKSYKFGEKEI